MTTCDCTKLEELQKWLRQLGLEYAITYLGDMLELNLSFKNISELPEIIGDLKNLERLYLNNNQIRKLPESISKLKNLQTLDLRNNQITSLPKTLTSINDLRCDDNVVFTTNKLQELQQWLRGLGQNYTIDELKNLQKLDLEATKINKQITELPAGIGELKNLKNLYLGGNKISKLPSTVGELKNLEKLYLDDNQIQELPDSIGNLSNLQYLWLHENQISKLPSTIGELKNLEKLYLDDNQIQELPPTIGELSNLKELWLQHNQITILPEALKRIKILRCDDNIVFISSTEGSGSTPQCDDLLSAEQAKELLYKYQLALWDEHDKKVVNDCIVGACKNIKSNVIVKMNTLKCTPGFVADTVKGKGYKADVCMAGVLISWGK